MRYDIGYGYLTSYAPHAPCHIPFEAQGMATKKKILVVEDDGDMRKMLVTALEMAEYQVFEAKDGQEGLQAFLSYSPDLALLDIRMPKIGGVQLCELLRHRTKAPIVMFSGVDDREEVVEAIQKGATDYVLKGSGVKNVVDRITKLIAGANQGDGSQEAADRGESDDKFSLKDNDVPVAVVVHKDRKARSEIKDILRQSQIQVRESQTGEEAITAVKRFNPLIVVIEERLADMTANDVLKELKKHPRRGGLAAIVAAGRRSPEAQRRAMYYGAQDYIHAPWDDGRLAMALRTGMVKAQKFRDEVKRILAQRRAAKEAQSKKKAS